MPTDSNKDPLDLLYVLKRRGISFDRWCQSVGIKTRKDFVEVQQTIESKGEYRFSKEMLDLCFTLPQADDVLLVKGQKPQEITESVTDSDTSDLLPPASLGPSKGQEQPVLVKRPKKSVST